VEYNTDLEKFTDSDSIITIHDILNREQVTRVDDGDQSPGMI